MVLKATLRVYVEPCPLKDLDVRLAQITGERGWDVYIVEASDDAGLDAALAAFRAYTHDELRILERQGTRALFHGRHVAEPVFQALREAGCPVIWPARYARGWGEFDVVAPSRSVLRDLVAALERLAPVTIAAVSEVGLGELDLSAPLAGLASGLTGKQADVLMAAVERGFYSSPRATSVEELATSFGISRSTLSEHLRKAERAALDSFAQLLRRHPTLQETLRGTGRPPRSRERRERVARDADADAASVARARDHARGL